MRARSTAAELTEMWRAQIEDCAQALSWSPDGNLLAVAALTGPISVFAVESGVVVQRLAGHQPGTNALAWRPQGDILASAGQDGCVTWWETTRWEAIASAPAGAAWVERVAWSPAGDQLASAARRTLRLWTAAGDLIREHNDHPSTIADIAWRPGGRELAAAVYGGVIVRNADAPEQRRHFAWKGSSLALAWSPTGKYIATGEQDATVHFWNVETGGDLQMWGYETKATQLAWNHTGRYLATGGSPTIVIWDCAGRGPEGTKPQTLKTHRAPITALAYQPGGALLASGGADARVVVWPLSRPGRAPAFAMLDAPITTLAWSPGALHLAVGDEAGTVLVARGGG